MKWSFIIHQIDYDFFDWLKDKRKKNVKFNKYQTNPIVLFEWNKSLNLESLSPFLLADEKCKCLSIMMIFYTKTHSFNSHFKYIYMICGYIVSFEMKFTKSKWITPLFCETMCFYYMRDTIQQTTKIDSKFFGIKYNQSMHYNYVKHHMFSFFYFYI